MRLISISYDFKWIYTCCCTFCDSDGLGATSLELDDFCRRPICQDAKGLDQVASSVKKGLQTLTHLSDPKLASVLVEDRDPKFV